MLAVDLRLALDPGAFAREALGFEPDEWQAGVLRWTGRRLLLNCCRQSGKSTTAAILALHRALYYPGSLVLLVSPSLRQSSELFRKVQGLFVRLDERPVLPEDNKLSCTLANGSRVVSLPGTEATIRGFSGADLIIEDEASRVDDSLYYAIRPMLAVSAGQLVLMSTPFGQRGHFHEAWTEGTNWQRVEVPGTACPRISPAFLAEERTALGELWYASEYECRFMAVEGSVFAYEDVQAMSDPTVQPLFGGRQWLGSM